jgi:Concanavalin A-like lectin/glucanases superfamily
VGDNERRTVRNRFCLVETAPGEQDGRFLGEVEVKKDDDGPHGTTWALNIKGGGTPKKPNAVEIPGTTNLGTTFTLSAMVKMTNTGLTRIFSSYSAVDPEVAPYEVLLDADPRGNSEFQGLRAVINGTHVRSQGGTVKIDPNTYHHFAMTYDEGYVRLYFDGDRVGDARVQGPGGPVFSYYELRVGHDWWPPATASEQQLVGWVDDILVLPRALNRTEIKDLCVQGAERYFKLTR